MSDTKTDWAGMSDQDFFIQARRVCREGDEAKARNPEPKPEPGVVQDDGSLDGLSNAEFNDALASYGVGFRVEEKLEEGLARGEQRRVAAEYDKLVAEHERRAKR